MLLKRGLRRAQNRDVGPHVLLLVGPMLVVYLENLAGETRVQYPRERVPVIRHLFVPVIGELLRACERTVAESADRNTRRAAAAEISEILRRAESATT